MKSQGEHNPKLSVEECPGCIAEEQDRNKRMTLSTMLTERAESAVKDDIIANLKRNRDIKKDRLVVAQDELNIAQKALDAVLEAFQLPTEPKGPYSRYENARFFLDSRSGGKGHFMEVIGGEVTCSCEGYQYGRTCWAKKHIEKNLDKDDSSWQYVGDRFSFNRRIRPTNAGFYRISAYVYDN